MKIKLKEKNVMDRFTCEEVFRRLDDYVDRELTEDEMRMVREHLETCAHCASEYQFEANFLRDVRSKVQRIACPPDLMSKISKALTGVSSASNNE
jgi:anti-sigma factor (TIGR02949 family)